MSTMSNIHSSSSSSDGNSAAGFSMPRLPPNATHADFNQFEPKARSYLSTRQVDTAAMIDVHFVADSPEADSGKLFIQMQQHLQKYDVGALNNNTIMRLLNQQPPANNNPTNTNQTNPNSSAHSTSSSSTTSTTVSTINTTTKTDELQEVRKYMAMSRLAYGLIFSMLPEDMQVVANMDVNVVRDYAYSLWQWIAGRFRRSAIDQLPDLWMTLLNTRKETERWTDFKASIDEGKRRIEVTGEAVPPGLYQSLLLGRLPPVV